MDATPGSRRCGHLVLIAVVLDGLLEALAEGLLPPRPEEAAPPPKQAGARMTPCAEGKFSHATNPIGARTTHHPALRAALRQLCPAPPDDLRSRPPSPVLLPSPSGLAATLVEARWAAAAV